MTAFAATRPAEPLEVVPYVRPLAEIDGDLADNTVRVRRLLDQLAGTRRALEIVEARRRRLLLERARSVAAVELEQLLDD